MFDRFRQARAQAVADETREEVEQQLEVLRANAKRAFQAYSVAQLNYQVDDVQGIVRKKNEVIYGVLTEYGLVEPRRPPTQWVGASHGVSIPIVAGMRYRVGQARGHVVQGEERPTIIDIGTVYITNQRIVFAGAKRSTEWGFAKLLGFSLDLSNAVIFNVANRQKASGIAYNAAADHIVEAAASAAIAAYQGPEDHAVVTDSYLAAYAEAKGVWEASYRQLNPDAASVLPLPWENEIV